MAAIATFSLALSAQDATKVQPRSYQVVFENDEVRVIRYAALPGMGVCGTGVHSHPRHLTILLTPARVRVTENGKTFVAVNKEGDVFWSEAGRHETENISGRGVRSLIVEFKRPRKS
ncbi:hypothetical protein NSU_0980 [Novosphingobium pentaromativorans US6-1]|uniref:Cytoplasmic protein n=1 Tax=Novosphingobium pentaromativorans US6-1 TaxID=1088721 RepID=G6E9F9_9SPHN|nr:hypothetical protein NSU_0980 [Novosphingobium pentaromativorans US6-1]